MARKKYIRDYRLVETVDERGRIRSDYEYIGEPYFYVLGAEAVRREKKRLLTLTAAGWLCYLGALTPNAASLRAFYTLLPLICAAIPLGIATDCLLTALPEKEPLRRQQADMLENRYPPAALAAAILPSAALVGALIRLLAVGGAGSGDGAFALCTAGLAAASWALFSRRGRLLCRKTGADD